MLSKQLVHHKFLLKILTNLVGVVGVSCSIASLIEFPAYSQQNQTATTPSFRVLVPSGSGTQNIGGNVTYPYGSRLFNNGTVQTSNGQETPPAVTIDHGNGYKTFYYPNGSHIDTNSSAIPPAMGTFIK